MYLAPVGRGFLLETEEDPGDQGFPGGCASSQKGPDHPATSSPEFRGLAEGACRLPHAEPGGPPRTRAGRGTGVTPSALGAAGRSLVIRGRKVCRAGWGGRAGGTQMNGRRRPRAQACSSRVHTRQACGSRARIKLACSSRACRSPGRGWMCSRTAGRSWARGRQPGSPRGSWCGTRWRGAGLVLGGGW